MASWYGPGFHGKNTANGETYDQHDSTAAHRTLQMPSVLRVTNLENGQSTVVRVNDRGPFARSRILDVSQAAAEELGMTRNGTARVRIDQLEAESQAVKQIAISGGGPDEQRAAIENVAGRRGTAVTATAQAPPPRTTARAATAAAAAARAHARRHGLSEQPAKPHGRAAGASTGLRQDRGSAAPSVASIATAATLRRPRAQRRAADSMSRPAPSRRPAMPRSSAADHQLRHRPRFPRVLGRAVRYIVCAWDLIRRRRPPASSPTG